jgi:hypothetical protein
MAGSKTESRESYWRRQVAACEASGLTIAHFCKRQGLSVGQYYWWRRALKQRRKPVSGALSFAEVTPVQLEASVSALLEVALANGRRIGVWPGFDAQTLSAVVRVLEGVSPEAGTC